MILKPFVPAVLMGIALWNLPLGLFSALTAGVIIYGTLLIVFRCVSLDEVRGYIHSVVR
jgi:hypothetical protein